MDKELNDYIVEIIQGVNEVQSVLKVLKDSLNNENNEITFLDIENTLEIIICKVQNTKFSLDKFVETIE